MYSVENSTPKKSNAAEELFVIKYPFGYLFVDEDIYRRIVKPKELSPDVKRICSVYFCHGIVRCSIAGGRKTYSLARLLLKPPKDKVVDHINRNPLDNRRCNLRIVSIRQNTLNVIAKNSTGLIGVSGRCHRGKRQLGASFRTSNGKRSTFYIYDSPINRIICALARDKFVLHAGDDEYAPLNLPILRNEPFRSELLKMNMNELRKENIKLFIKKLAIEIQNQKII
jgi:hypothetical protein